MKMLIAFGLLLGLFDAAATAEFKAGELLECGEANIFYTSVHVALSFHLSGHRGAW
jgi:hypothetical protein